MRKTAMLNTSDVDLAWRRAKYDARERGFVTHPFLIDLIEVDRPAWLRNLEAGLKRAIRPGAALPCFVPKPNFMLRPRCVLAKQDEVIYNALVGACMPEIWKGLRPSQGDPDVAYQLLPPEKRSKQWVLRGTAVWRQFREKSIALLTPSVSCVVTTDITGFYENIDIQRLLSDIRALAVRSGSADSRAPCPP